MEKISSAFFCLALLVYYIPKLLKLRKSRYIKIHIIAGVVSITAMIISLISRIGQESFLKYCGFTVIMMSIGLTGYLMKKKNKTYRKLHIAFTVLYFVYVHAAIFIM